MLGQYHVLDELGESALGPLHLARLEGPKGFQRWAALRIVSAIVSGTLSTELYARARAAASLIHPNVAALFEINEQEDGMIWLAYELVSGAPLAEIAERVASARTPVPWEIAARLVQDAAEGLHAIHDRAGRSKIALHGTIAPWRMLASFDGKTKIVGAFEPRIEKEPERLAYTAPEDIFGEPIDVRADVFTLGVVLWELCAGRRLFQAATPEETCAMIEAHRVQRVASIVRGFPASVEEVIKKALASRPDARFGTLRDLGRAISSAYVAERKVVSDEDVARYVKSLCADIAARQNERLREASDTTEVYRRGRKSLSSEVPTPALGERVVDPNEFDDERMTEEMRTAKLTTQIDDRTQEMPTSEVLGGRAILDSTAATPPLGADTVRDLAAAAAATPRAGTPTSRPPPPPEPSPPPLEAPPRSERRALRIAPVPAPPSPARPKKKSRPPSSDAFDDAGVGSEVFFARSADGQRLVRKPPARTAVADPAESVVVESEPPSLGDERRRRSSQRSSDAPGSLDDDTRTIPSRRPPSAPAQAELDPYAPTPATGVPTAPAAFAPPARPLPPPNPPPDSAKHGFMFAALGATIGVACFLVIVSLAGKNNPQQPPVPTATMTYPPAATTTVTTAATTAVTHAPIPTVPISALPTSRTARPPAPKTTTQRTAAPPPAPPPPAGKGYLTVMCQPACDDVILDGARSLGETPLIKAQVPAGQHRLLLRITSPPLEKTVDVSVTPDETTLIKPVMK